MKKFKRTKSRLKDRQTKIIKIMESGKKRHSTFALANAIEVYEMAIKMERWKNDLYEVHVERDDKLVHLLVSRLDGAASRNWRHMQQIKNELVGPQCEGVELYPAERRLIDQANMYHLWVIDENDDASTFELPEYIHSRLQPQIVIDFPERDEERAILKENLPFADDEVLDYVTDFLQAAHAADERYTARDGINIGRFGLKLAGVNSAPGKAKVLHTAVVQTLGREALRYVPRG